MKTANDTQIGGTHYRTDEGDQHWDLMAHLYGEAHFKCTATKYIARWRAKNGAQDLAKAKHYLQKLLELWESDTVDLAKPHYDLFSAVRKFTAVEEDSSLIVRILSAETPQGLIGCIAAIDLLMASLSSDG